MRIKKRETFLIGYLNISHLQAGQSREAVEAIIDKVIGATHISWEVGGVWYFVGWTLTLFLSMFRWNYEVVLLYLTLSLSQSDFRLTLVFREINSNQRTIRPSCEHQVSFNIKAHCVPPAPGYQGLLFLFFHKLSFSY